MWNYLGTVVKRTVPLQKSKLFTSGPHPIIVLTTVLIRTRRTDAKNSLQNYQGQVLPEKMRFENT